MPPVVYSPVSGTPFPSAGGTIKWYNGHGTHSAKTVTQWRLLVGSTSYGENYHSGAALSPTHPLQDAVFNVTMPPRGKTCYVVPEYTLANGQISYGTITTFTAD